MESVWYMVEQPPGGWRCAGADVRKKGAGARLQSGTGFRSPNSGADGCAAV